MLRFTNVYGDQYLTSEPIARSMSLLMICVFPNNEVITNLDIVISFHRREHFGLKSLWSQQEEVTVILWIFIQNSYTFTFIAFLVLVHYTLVQV